METAERNELLWQIDLLGTLQARGGSHRVERFPTQKTAGLLAILAFAPGRLQTRERLVDVLWPEADLAAGRDRLSQALVWLRPQLEPGGTPRGSVLRADRKSVSLAAEAVTTDVAQFESALRAAEQTYSAPERRKALEKAVSYYGGELLPGLYSDWVLSERQRLLQFYLTALGQIGRIFEEAGQFSQALDWARRALAADPLQEDAHRDLIRLLAAAGQSAAAMRQFQDLKSLLARELDCGPSAETIALVEQIGRSPSSLKARTVRPVRLPASVTRFFGREEEIATVRRMVRTDGARQVTLLGIGGAGKTRLALAVAADLQDSYGDAIAFVPLADLPSAEAILPAIAQALHLPVSTPDLSWEQIAGALQTHPSLLILDNLEHLLPEASPLIRALLEQAPALTVLATSRQRLGVSGEREVPVLPLPLPGPSATADQIYAAPSVQLFVDRARSVRSDFTITPANASLIAQVCARLEGIPLAMELCAAWAQTLTPAQMLTQLTRRFDLLVSRHADTAPRHQTLRAALEYSYQLLPDDLKLLFARLSVFRGGWSLEAAQQVCAEEADSLLLLAQLTQLRERSLLVAEESKEAEASEMRYGILETLREFAAEQLPLEDQQMLRQRHLAYFLAQAEADHAQEEHWLAQMTRERENMRAALGCSLEDGGVEWGLRLGTALSRYWTVRGPLSEGGDWLRRLLDRSEEERLQEKCPLPDSVRAESWNALGRLTWSQGNYEAAQTAHAQALALRRLTGSGVAESLYHLGITAYRRDDYSAAQGYLEESLALSYSEADQAGVARVLLNLGNIAYEKQELASAEEFFQQSLALEQALGNRQRVANGYNNLALNAIAARDYPKAEALLNQALAIRHELTDHYGAATALVALGSAARLQQKTHTANALLQEGLQLAQTVGDRHITAIYLMEFGLLALAEGDPERAVPLLAASERLFDKLGSSPGSVVAADYQQALATVRAIILPLDLERLWLQGQITPPEQIVSQLLEK